MQEISTAARWWMVCSRTVGTWVIGVFALRCILHVIIGHFHLLFPADSHQLLVMDVPDFLWSRSTQMLNSEAAGTLSSSQSLWIKNEAWFLVSSQKANSLNAGVIKPGTSRIPCWLTLLERIVIKQTLCRQSFVCVRARVVMPGINVEWDTDLLGWAGAFGADVSAWVLPAGPPNRMLTG